MIFIGFKPHCCSISDLNLPVAVIQKVLWGCGSRSSHLTLSCGGAVLCGRLWIAFYLGKFVTTAQTRRITVWCFCTLVLVVMREKSDFLCRRLIYGDWRVLSNLSLLVLLKGASLPVMDLTELPKCTVCLERMDESVNGILTTLCNHSFHSQCLQRWEDTT